MAESCRIVSNSSEKDLGVKADHKTNSSQQYRISKKRQPLCWIIWTETSLQKSCFGLFFQHWLSAASSLGYHFSRGMWSRGESPEEHEDEQRTRKCHGQRAEVIKPEEEDSATVFKYGKRLLQKGTNDLFPLSSISGWNCEQKRFRLNFLRKKTVKHWKRFHRILE